VVLSLKILAAPGHLSRGSGWRHFAALYITSKRIVAFLPQEGRFPGDEEADIIKLNSNYSDLLFI
jgi:hypothetical protein